MKKIILHIDMDYFFAQIEERENPHFKGKPLVVGGDPKKGRGVVSTCNYEARKYGIHSGMAISKAFSLCPQAIFLPVSIDLYKRISQRIFSILKKFSKKCEIISLDECFLDISFIGSYQSAEKLARRIKKEIYQKERLTSSIGIGPNKLIAKIASKKAKPNGILIIREEEIEDFLNPLDIKEIPGIGPRTSEKLRKMGVDKIKDLKNLSREKLKEMFGRVGERIYEKARGIDKSEVIPEKIIKSIGKQHTFEKDTKDAKFIFEIFERLLREIYLRLKKENLYFKTIEVKYRFYDFETHIRSKTLSLSSQEFEVLKKEAKKLLLKALIKNNRKPFRMLGIRVKIC